MSDDRLLAACALAREAGLLARRRLAGRAEGGLAVEEKGPQDPVSAADREAEALIRARLARAFPGDGVLGEEEGGEAAERLWVVDPIDGTANYVRAMPGFSVSIAYVEGGRTQLGVVYAPMDDEMFVAARGAGAFCNGEAIGVTGCTSLARAIVGLGYSVRTPRGPFLGALDRLLAAGGEFRRLGSTALGLPRVAPGRLDAFWTPGTNSWDCLAGLLLVAEAGGWASDFLAGGGILGRRAALGCAPALAGPLRAVLAAG
ncbi:MAG: inositol monophosphatase [Rhodospirillaceae bacterium]|nr:inositol monophosphatase [Rhodospirillaceae bacterium]